MSLQSRIVSEVLPESPAQEVLKLISESKTAIQEFIYILNNAIPMENELHIVRVTMWDDRCNDMKELLTNILNEVN